MAYRIEAGEEVASEIQRIAREQIDKAIAEVNDNSLSAPETVHQVRKRCKKIRGLLRLVRPQLGDVYQAENAWYRDSARGLSNVRDAEVRVETFDNLIGRFEQTLDVEAFTPIRERLVSRQEQSAARDLRDRLHEFSRRMEHGRARVASWRIDAESFGAIDAGLRLTYRRGRAAMKDARRVPSDEGIHEWRKRVKYHGYHLRLLQCIWEQPMKARQEEVETLGNYLGDDHDLSVLRRELLEPRNEPGATAAVETLVGLIGRRQLELRTRAEELGRRVFAEKPKRFSRRMEALWESWQQSGNDNRVTRTD